MRKMLKDKTSIGKTKFNLKKNFGFHHQERIKMESERKRREGECEKECRMGEGNQVGEGERVHGLILMMMNRVCGHLKVKRQSI